MKKLGKYLLLIGILVIPFTHLPVMPSFYRPVSVYFFLFGYFFLGHFRKSLTFEELILYVFFFYVSFLSIILLFFSSLELSGVIRNIVPIIVGIVSYVSVKKYFRCFSVDNAIRWMYYVFLFALIIGLIEILVITGILPFFIKAKIGLLFTTKVSSRLQLLSSEPAWASKIVLFFLPFLFYLFNKTKEKKFLVVLLLFLVELIFMYSFHAILILLLFLGLYFIFKLDFRTLNYKKIALITVAVVLTVFLFLKFAGLNQYFSKRLEKVKQIENIGDVVYWDESTFIRLGYPYMGIEMFFDNPLGLGMGGYAIHFEEYLIEMTDDYENYPEVVNDLESKSADPKSLYVKLLSETGILGTLFFLLFLLYHFWLFSKHKTQLPLEIKELLYQNLIMAVVLMIQTGTFAFVPFWFILALNSSWINKTIHNV